MINVKKIKETYNRQTLNGIVLVALFASAAFQISQIDLLSSLGISPLIVGIVLGIFYGNTLRQHLPQEWVPGILFSSKILLRIGIVFFGFRITFQDLWHVGIDGLLISCIMVTTTFLLGSFCGPRFFGLSPRLSMLTAAGSSICGAAAVLATEPVVRAKPHESSIAVGTVVLFGTLSMFLYPILQKTGILGLSAQEYGMFVGGTIHEVAHAVAAGQAVSFDAGNTAVIVKMLRVMLIAPLLIFLGLWLAHKTAAGEKQETRIVFPWFALFFILCAGFNSLGITPASVVAFINKADVFILTMAMCALGIETRLEKVRKVGAAPFYLAILMYLWLTLGGYGVTRLILKFI